MIQAINYTDVAVVQGSFNGTVLAGGTNVVVGPANFVWRKNVFIINAIITFWGSSGGVGVGPGAFAFLAFNGLDLNNSGQVITSPSKVLYCSCTTSGLELDIFRRVSAAGQLSITTNLTLDAVKPAATTLEMNISIFYIMEG